jgi:hypothetical protein
LGWGVGRLPAGSAATEIEPVGRFGQARESLAEPAS